MHPVIETLNTSRQHLKVQEELFSQSIKMAGKERPSLADKADGASYALHKAGEILDETISCLLKKDNLTVEDVFFALSPVESRLTKLHDTWSHFIEKTSERSLFNIMGGTIYGFDLALSIIKTLFCELKNFFGYVGFSPVEKAI